MDDEERSELAASILASLEERGVPQGSWLVDIAAARRNLSAVDDLLRRLQDAIIRSASASTPMP